MCIKSKKPLLTTGGRRTRAWIGSTALNSYLRYSLQQAQRKLNLIKSLFNSNTNLLSSVKHKVTDKTSLAFQPGTLCELSRSFLSDHVLTWSGSELRTPVYLQASAIARGSIDNSLISQKPNDCRAAYYEQKNCR